MTPSTDRLITAHPLSGTVVLSPHSDDAAFSLAGAVSESLLPSPITVVTVFDRTTFVVGRGAGSLWRATRRRTREDAHFCRSIGARHLRLGMLDACVRFPDISIEALFSATVSEPELLADLTERIQELAAAHQDCLLLAPLAIGGHIDHELTRAAAAAAGWTPLAHYADQPYALQDKSVPYDNAVPVKLSDSTRAAKLFAANHYRSQPATAQLVSEIGSRNLGEIVEWLVTS